jgi:tungstate transport system ATP-binding protein
MIMKAPALELPITLENASVAAGDVFILQHINLTFAPGPPSVIIGPNGAGKTTLLHVAMGLIRLSSGQITWGGRELQSSRRRAIVFQRPVMLRRSTEANLRYALRTSSRPIIGSANRIRELLALVGLEHLSRRPARNLSAGEQQRLALARALARDPAVLFLDEPTANLDPAATRLIEDIIATVSRQGIKVILATHDLGEARRLAGDIVLLQRGRVVETNESASFFKAPASETARKFLAGELLDS